MRPRPIGGADMTQGEHVVDVEGWALEAERKIADLRAKLMAWRKAMRNGRGRIVDLRAELAETDGMVTQLISREVTLHEEIAALRDKVERMEAVVEAARTWRRLGCEVVTDWSQEWENAFTDLVRALAALDAGKEDGA